MARPHGVRQQDWLAMQASERERKDYNRQRAATLQTSAEPRPVVEVRQLCWCSSRPIPHLHGPMELKAFEQSRMGEPWGKIDAPDWSGMTSEQVCAELDQRSRAEYGKRFAVEEWKGTVRDGE
jgi:hypothetical protein